MCSIGRHVIQAQAQAVAGHPAPLTNAEWDLVTDALPVLDAFNAAVHLVHGDETTAGSYLPTATAFQNSLTNMDLNSARVLLAELNDCEDRHLTKCPDLGLFANHEGRRFKT